MVIEALRACGSAHPYAVLDADPKLWGKSLLGIPVLGGDDLLPQLLKQGARSFIIGLGAAGDNRPRKRLYEFGIQQDLVPVSAIHPTAVVSPSASIGAGVFLGPLSVVNAGASIGVNTILNTGAIVEHDCRIGDHAHVATGARLASTVQVGRLAHVGAGATVKQCVRIGEGAIVGAGAVVVGEVEPWTTVAGVPARPLASKSVKKCQALSDRHFLT